MKKTMRKVMLAAALAALGLLISGCGCGKSREADPESSKVMEIDITPEASPTPEPSAVPSAAVTTNGNLTMINGYLAGKGEEDARDGEAQTEEQTDAGTDDAAEAESENGVSAE